MLNAPAQRFVTLSLSIVFGCSSALFAQETSFTSVSETLPTAHVSSSESLPTAPVAVASALPFAAASTSLPDAPAPQAATPQPADSDHTDGQSKRIFGIIPNFRAVNADVHLPPQSVKDKFVTASEDSFDYSSIFIPLAVAGYDDARNSTPEFGTGGAAYGRYLWHSVVDQTSENYFVEFIVPVATHEDTRYYSLARGGFLKRAGYSLSRVVITRSDSGDSTFNFSEIVGAGAAAGVSTLYYPSRERSLSNTGSQWATSIGIDALGFFVKEFSPDITHSVFHGGKIFHRPGSPASAN